MNTPIRTFRCSDDLYNSLKKQADMLQWSVGRVIRWALVDKFKDGLPPEIREAEQQDNGD